MSTLDVKGLTVRLPKGGDRPEAISDISFSVERGEILCLVGESGSGKTVIAHSIMGLLPKTLTLARGEVRLEGEELTRAAESRRRQLRRARHAIGCLRTLSTLHPRLSF